MISLLWNQTTDCSCTHGDTCESSKDDATRESHQGGPTRVQGHHVLRELPVFVLVRGVQQHEHLQLKTWQNDSV